MLKTKKEIEAWLEEMQIVNYSIYNDLTVDVRIAVNLKAKNLTEIPVQFNKVDGDFDISYNNLVSLKGCPKIVGGGFDFSKNKVTSFLYCPESVSGYVECSNNYLINFNHFAKEVGSSIYCSKNNISSLNGLPKNISGNFQCKHNNLKSLKSSLKSVDGFFHADYNEIETLIGMPFIKNTISLSHNNIKNLKGIQEEVWANLDISDNKLISLENGPKIVSGDYMCFDNKYKNLKGSPKKVNYFACGSENLESFEGCPEKTFKFTCRYAPKIKSIKDLKIYSESIDLKAVPIDTLESDILYCNDIVLNSKKIKSKYKLKLSEDNVTHNKSDFIILNKSELDFYVMQKKFKDNKELKNNSVKKMKL